MSQSMRDYYTTWQGCTQAKPSYISSPHQEQSKSESEIEKMHHCLPILLYNYLKKNQFFSVWLFGDPRLLRIQKERKTKMQKKTQKKKDAKEKRCERKMTRKKNDAKDMIEKKGSERKKGG